MGDGGHARVIRQANVKRHHVLDACPRL
jgi:hypothetical protein